MVYLFPEKNQNEQAICWMHAAGVIVSAFKNYWLSPKTF